jgi:hypothetical protein
MMKPTIMSSFFDHGGQTIKPSRISNLTGAMSTWNSNHPAKKMLPSAISIFVRVRNTKRKFVPVGEEAAERSAAFL